MSDWRDLLVLDDDGLLALCDTEVYRGSGPGGQKRNKTSSAVRIRCRSTGLAGQSSDSRKQVQNRRYALQRLRRRIAFTLRGSPACGCSGGAGHVVGRMDRIKRTAPREKQIHPGCAHMRSYSTRFVVAKGVVSACADDLGITTGALNRLLSTDSELKEHVNRMRVELGLKRLK